MSAQAVRESERRKIEKGGRRMPSGVMSPEAASALTALLKAGYAKSMNACIERALIDSNTNRKGK